MNVFRSSGIRQRFTSVFVAVITVIMLTFSAVLVLYNSRSIESELRTQLENLSDLSSKSLSSALWQYNYDYVADYIDSLFLYEEIVFARVMSGENIVKTRVRQNFRDRDLKYFLNSEEFLVKETDVLYKDVNVGKVLMAMSRDRISQEILKNSAFAIMLLFLMISAIFVTTFLLSRKYLFRPLSHLENSAKLIAGGDLNATIEVGGEDEIGQLAATFKQMMDNLKLITASRDELDKEVQERKKAENALRDSLTEKEILLREIHHRVKNNMQIIQSLLSLQSHRTQSSDLKQALLDSNNRIKSMALIHETLYRSDDLSELKLSNYFQNILNYLYKIYHDPQNSIEWSVEVEPVRLDLDRSIACGLIINELVTNALKYAFIGTKGGKLEVGLKLCSNAEAELYVSDNGVGLPEDFDLQSAESLGLKIVRMLSEDQLDGTLHILRQDGLKFQIRLPLNKVIERGPI